MARPLTIAVLFDNFGPYHLARLMGASKHARITALQVRAKSLTYAWRSPDDCTDVARTLLSDEPVSWDRLKASLTRELGAQPPDVLAIPGWSELPALAALDWAVARGIPTVVMSESNVFDAPRGIVSEAIKQRVVALFDAGLVSGSNARAYLTTLGLDPKRIEVGYGVVDNQYFAAAAVAAEASGRMPLVDGGQPLAKEHRNAYFLACARFVAKKNLPGLIEGYRRYRERSLAVGMAPSAVWPLVIVGDGEEHAALEVAIARAELTGCVHLPGFRQYEELPVYYATAGAFVHASTVEQWGLVINEAMASELPVAVSTRCGAAADLVVEGRNGVLFDPEDRDAIASALYRLAVHPNRSELGRESARIISNWSPDRFGSGLAAAARHARATPPRSRAAASTLVSRALARVLAR